MVAPVTVKEKDLRTLLGIVGDDRSDLPAAGLPPSLLSECLINDPMAPWSWGGARLVPWRVC